MRYIPGSSLCPDGAAVHCAHVGNPFSTSHVGQSSFLSATQNIWKIIQCHFVNSVFFVQHKSYKCYSCIDRS